MLFDAALSAISGQDLAQHRAPPPTCVWVQVAATRGSVPRESDAGMLVFAGAEQAEEHGAILGTTDGAILGTVGGGHLELKAIELARDLLARGALSATRRHFPLGPALGQCCGGAVDLLFMPITSKDEVWLREGARIAREGGTLRLATRLDASTLPHTRALAPNETPDQTPNETLAAEPDNIIFTTHVFTPWPIWVFGAGHVGRALVQVLATLDARITWVDERESEFPTYRPANVEVLVSDAPALDARCVPAGATALVLTHSHALDLDIARALLVAQHAAFVGTIGSQTKATLFRRRLAARGVSEAALQKFHCPIGARTLASKHPGAIAVEVAHTLLLQRQVTQLQQRKSQPPSAQQQHLAQPSRVAQTNHATHSARDQRAVQSPDPA